MEAEAVASVETAVDLEVEWAVVMEAPGEVV